MDNQEIKAGEITADIIDQQADSWKQAVEESTSASEAYMADLADRKEALAKRASEYQVMAKKTKKARDKAAEQVTDLTSRGRFDEAAAAEIKVEKLDQTISVLGRKIRLVSTAELKGDSDLYEVAKQAHEKAESEREACVDGLHQMYCAVQGEIHRLNEMKTKISNLSEYVRKFGPNDNFISVDRHFRELDRIERENRERWQAEQAAQKARG